MLVMMTTQLLLIYINLWGLLHFQTIVEHHMEKRIKGEGGLHTLLQRDGHKTF